MSSREMKNKITQQKKKSSFCLLKFFHPVFSLPRFYFFFILVFVAGLGSLFILNLLSVLTFMLMLIAISFIILYSLFWRAQYWCFCYEIFSFFPPYFHFPMKKKYTIEILYLIPATHSLFILLQQWKTRSV